MIYPAIDPETRRSRLEIPSGKVRAILDTDTYNEIDDQFAITYLLSCKENQRRCRLRKPSAVCITCRMRPLFV